MPVLSLIHISRTGKPIIMSTGIAYLADIELALRTCKEEGNENVIPVSYTHLDVYKIQEDGRAKIERGNL